MQALVATRQRLAVDSSTPSPGHKFAEPSIGRVMTVGTFRRFKIGRALMTEAIAFTERTFPGTGIQIGAQAHLQEFYQSLGFQSDGDVYEEDGIPHVDMVKPAQSSI
ncbi:GNAT family N-acetyltransferase [Stutzerimonas nitrititolerans]|uniref:GNAT family N-acetyltransferase n=1 Tax=Stutzerimonas nitrititolerans TaxID=2482751 RepID=UPI00289A4D7E|nr:GNAT family N-acetyltransferase [Stutzerimonas nitrititolerans]